MPRKAQGMFFPSYTRRTILVKIKVKELTALDAFDSERKINNSLTGFPAV